MKYCGGKSVKGSLIGGILEAIRDEGQDYRENMCGALGVAKHVASGRQHHPALIKHLDVGDRFLNDKFAPVIDMWQRMISEYNITGDLASFPTFVTKEEWLRLKKDPKHPHHAWVGFSFAFKGVFFGAYFITEKGNLLKPALEKVIACRTACFSALDYEARDENGVYLIDPAGELIYDDPPYANRGGIKQTAEFDSERHWQRCNEYSLRNTITVSEYIAPDGWFPLASWKALASAAAPTATGGAKEKPAKVPKFEHLFVPKDRLQELRKKALERLKKSASREAVEFAAMDEHLFRAA